MWRSHKALNSDGTIDNHGKEEEDPCDEEGHSEDGDEFPWLGIRDAGESGAIGVAALCVLGVPATAITLSSRAAAAVATAAMVAPTSTSAI
jgi:hypothetical protein